MIKAINKFPERSTYGKCSKAELPFRKRKPDGRRSNWTVPPTDDYVLANKIGYEYAAHYVQYIKDNPDIVGMSLLGMIAKDIDFADTKTKGYWVGFFAYLEQMIHFAAKDIDIYESLGPQIGIR